MTRMDVPEAYESLRRRIAERYETLSPHLQRIARTALDEPNLVALQTIAVIAGRVGVQPSTLIRFAKEFGYDGFSRMQQVFKLRLIEGAVDGREQVFETRRQAGAADVGAALQASIESFRASLDALEREVDPDDLARAVDMCAGAGHIYVAGLRRARPIARYFAYGMNRLERTCSLLDFGGGMAAQQVTNMSRGDLLFATAFPPYSEPVVEVVRDAHLRGIPVLALTDGEASPLHASSTMSFFVDAGPRPTAFRPISGAICLVHAIVESLSGA